MSDPVSIEEIRAMSPEELRNFKRKAALRIFKKIILPKIALSVTIAVVSHMIAKAINDKLDELDDDDTDEDTED